ncbi:MAG: hypothetical protein M1817_006023 [Caeruleum heppii]|nr:MAG: hypothetical protein M1817_006023 [Caeruleum heppii]
MPLGGTQSPLPSSPTSSAQKAIELPTSHIPTADPITRLEIYSTRLSNPLVTSLSGAVGGIASGIVTCPLDVIKTKLQAQGGFESYKPGEVGSHPAYRGLVGTAESIWREEGVRGMYRGLFPIILGYFPTWAVYFTVYDVSKDFWYKRLGEDASRPQRRKLLAQVMASISAGACSTLVTNPIWVIKTRLMSQVGSHSSRGNRPPWQYKSTFDAARKMYRTEGIWSFYSGLTPALLGLTHVAIQFPLYEYLKFRFTGSEMGEKQEGDGRSHWAGMSVATVVSKVCASSATYPHEVLRTRLQTQQRALPVQSPEGLSFRGGLSRPREAGGYPTPADGARTTPRYRGVVNTFKTILREEGWRAFYNGMGTNMLRTVPAATTTILTYEYMVGTIRRMQSEGTRKMALLESNPV